METNKRNLDFIVSAPGKIILFGEHSVVFKKAAVSTSIARRLSVIVSPSEDNKIFIKFPDVNFQFSCFVEQLNSLITNKCPVKDSNVALTLNNPDIISDPDYIESLKNDIKKLNIFIHDLEDKSLNTLLGFLFVIRGMCSIFDSNLIPFKLEVSSELEVGAGTGSSAAFAVAISGAVYHYVRCLNNIPDISKVDCSFDNDNIEIKCYPIKSGFSLEEVKIINKWAFCIEKIMHGYPSGIDNTTCTFGSIVVTSQKLQRPGELVFRFLDNIPMITILLIATGVSRNTSNLVANVRKLREFNSASVDAIFCAMDVIALEAFKIMEDLGHNNSEELFKVLGKLMELNHGLLRTLGVSHESLEHIVNVSSLFGLSSKLTGAGGGGYAITLVPPNFPKNKLEAMKTQLGQSYKVTEVTIGEDGVRLEKLVK